VWCWWCPPPPFSPPLAGGLREVERLCALSFCIPSVLTPPPLPSPCLFSRSSRDNHQHRRHKETTRAARGSPSQTLESSPRLAPAFSSRDITRSDRHGQQRRAPTHTSTRRTRGATGRSASAAAAMPFLPLAVASSHLPTSRLFSLRALPAPPHTHTHTHTHATLRVPFTLPSPFPRARAPSPSPRSFPLLCSPPVACDDETNYNTFVLLNVGISTRQHEAIIDTSTACPPVPRPCLPLLPRTLIYPPSTAPTPLVFGMTILCCVSTDGGYSRHDDKQPF
jgi:hypothetical protein